MLERKQFDVLFRTITALSLACTAGLLLIIVAVLIAKGAGRISFAFLTEAPSRGGAEGGIGPAIVGTTLLAVAASLVAMPLGLSLALLQTEYLRSPTARRLVDLLLYTTNGVPSILFGLFGYHLLVKRLGLGKSWLAGGLVLGLMITPAIAVAVRERIRALPRAYREQARALGLSRAKVIWAVVIPQSLGGMITGTLLGVARACGETAPIMMTAAVFSGAGFPRGLRESPVLALPYHIFNLAQDSHDPAAVQAAWTTALVLVIAALALNLAAIPLHRRAGAGAETEAA